jgi:hypothetical protein
MGAATPRLCSAPLTPDEVRFAACVFHPSLENVPMAQLRLRAPLAPPTPGDGADFDPAADLAPFVPSASDPFDERKAAHLMRRAGFGARPEELPAIVALGVDRTVDLLLIPSTAGLRSYGAQVLPHGEVLDLNYDVAAQRAQWLSEMVHGFYPLKEKMALFFSDHFSVGVETTQASPLLIPHVNIFRRHGLGSFRQMLIDVSRDPAMLYWLDNYLNGVVRGGVPVINENYGREVLELYTMGVNGGYTQADVVEVSKCLSGWGVDGYNTYLYTASRHVTGPKTVLGQTIPSMGEQEVYYLFDNVILPWPATAEYMVRKIWEYFVAPAPSPALVTELANRFRADKFNLRSLMSTILRSRYFYSDAAIGTLVKNPVEFVIGAMRGTNTSVNSYRTLSARIVAMGYPLLRYTNPFGLEDGDAWLDSSTIVARANFANELTQVSTTAGFQNRFDPAREIVRANLTTSNAIVDHFLRILLPVEPPQAVRTALYDFMNRVDTGVVPFTFTPAKISEKVRGLVHLILALPEYQLN